MASSNNGNRTMAEQERRDGDGDDDVGVEDRDDAAPPRQAGGAGAATVVVARPPAGGDGFFTIYKRGQGYWTRMGTAIGAALIAAVVVYEMFQYLPAIRTDGRQVLSRNAIVLIAIGFLAAYGLLVWWLMNRPTNADFLIATDSEMKKVNWTSRRELVGSTKVVVVFMFLIAFILFVLDTAFHYLFYWIDVLKFKPFGA